MSKVNQSHPRSLWRTVKKTLANDCGIKSGNHILLGVSGGSDSMALLHVLSRLRGELDIVLSAISINHNLRKEARDEVIAVENFCKQLDVEFYSSSIYIEPGSNLQARAREKRYEVFRDIKEQCGANYIATAHHMEDRAETVLIRMLRGTSAQGLGVLAPKTTDVLRPMIYARKRDVMLHIERKGISYCEDPSNKNTEKYLRSKIRYKIMPELQKINPNIVESLCNLSESAEQTKEL